MKYYQCNPLVVTLLTKASIEQYEPAYSELDDIRGRLASPSYTEYSN
jgi:hypothetical protein